MFEVMNFSKQPEPGIIIRLWIMINLVLKFQKFSFIKKHKSFPKYK